MRRAIMISKPTWLSEVIKAPFDRTRQSVFQNCQIQLLFFFFGVNFRDWASRYRSGYLYKRYNDLRCCRTVFQVKQRQSAALACRINSFNVFLRYIKVLRGNFLEKATAKTVNYPADTKIQCVIMVRQQIKENYEIFIKHQINRAPNLYSIMLVVEYEQFLMVLRLLFICTKFYFLKLGNG